MMRATALLVWLAIASIAAVAADTGGVARAFMKLDAQTETGINSRDYSVLVGEANLELKLYEASAAGKAHPDAVRLFWESLVQYMIAQELWRYKLMPKFNRYATTDIAIESDIGRGFAQQFPNALRTAEEGGALLSRDSKAFHIDYMFAFYWKAASDLSKQAIGRM